jgi:hypothetical protein
MMRMPYQNPSDNDELFPHFCHRQFCEETDAHALWGIGGRHLQTPMLGFHWQVRGSRR